MGTKSQLFRVFVEGETISDGRKITADMIDDCVATFDLKTYTPRINIEHIAGYSPEPPFNGYGDVIAVEARDDEFSIAGKAEKRRALYAQVDANDQLVKLGKADQKPFPSVELTPSYAGTGKIGLVGLAFTDTPASIGTERLKFSSRAPGTVFAYGSEAVGMEFDAASADPTGIAEAIVAGFSRAIALFKPQAPEPKKDEPKEPANDNDAKFATVLETLGTTFAAAIKPIADAQVAADKRFTALETRLTKEEVPGGFSRTPATGGGNAVLTDC
jgi:hypothetical protein